ncbi:MAG: dephospho-CoA kinase [Armatimonadetes bacterium]|nr:dephospho-CoA kinase [Armatimonadota bacterium]
MNEGAAPFLFKLAITGGIAEGKSTVVSLLAGLGLTTCSADDVVRQMWGEEAFLSDVQSCLGLDDRPDKAIVRGLIAADQDKRRSMNRLTHNAVLERMASSGADVHEVPLLVEGCLSRLYRRVWVVTCGADEQLRRLTERIGSSEEARGLLASQLPTEVKCAFGDAIVRTNQQISNVKCHVESLAIAHRLI